VVRKVRSKAAGRLAKVSKVATSPAKRNR
jgi:hypothetical protein